VYLRTRTSPNGSVKLQFLLSALTEIGRGKKAGLDPPKPLFPLFHARARTTSFWIATADGR
jgi:hypothetical protein